MTTGEKVILWVGIIALVVFLVCLFLYLWYKKKIDLKKFTLKKRSINAVEKNEQSFEAKSYSSNPQLDGARVSHRRNHPDRIEEENIWDELKEREKSEIQRKLELDRKNKLLMIFSPCNADVIRIYENAEEAMEDGYSYPGVLLLPNDDKIYAPMNGIVSWEEENGSFRVTSDTGAEVFIKSKYKSEDAKNVSDCVEKRVENGANICMGEMIGQFRSGLIKRNNKSIYIHMELTSFNKEQLLLVKRTNYVSHGDKVLTIRLE